MVKWSDAGQVGLLRADFVAKVTAVKLFETGDNPSFIGKMEGP
jgi:hypothetical protein